MTNETTAWLFRPGISRRIVLAMVLSLIAVQAQAFLQLWVFSQPELRLTGTRWLAETTGSIVRETFALPANERANHLSRLASQSDLLLSWSKQRPEALPDVQSISVTHRLSATLDQTLGKDVNAFEVATTELDRIFPSRRLNVEVLSGMNLADLGKAPIAPGEPDVLIAANVRIAVQGRDGSWVSISPIGYIDSGFPGALPFTPLLAAGLIIGLVSILTARRIVAPLDRLVQAAERIGTAREPVRIAPDGLHEFAAVARAFEEMQVRLLRFVDDRTQMLAAISHDLRSSLTRLRIAAETGPSTGIAADKSAIIAEIGEMQSMVESTLAFALGEAQSRPTQATDVAALIISLVDSAGDAGHHCGYTGPDHVEVLAHPLSLKRAFGNLIDNAIKYGGAARVTLEPDGRQVRIIIEDDGPGIPPDQREEVFQPFRRLDPSRSGEIPGAGLGLTIARDAIQSHGGIITLDAASSGGLRVLITLPRASN